MVRKCDRFLHDFSKHRQKNTVLTILLFAYRLNFLTLVWNSDDACLCAFGGFEGFLEGSVPRLVASECK